jgi:EmrB/QacA subfamily drug resistance transporter
LESKAIDQPVEEGFDPALKRLCAVVVLGAIMSILDTTIVNVAIDTLGGRLHTSLSTIQWVTTGYMLALAMVIPLTGWSAARFGTKRMWMVSLALFLGGSALCGLAWSVGSLIFFRILQGAGGGLILPLAQTILAQAAGPQRLGRVMSVIGVPMMLGPVLGPVIGGFIVDSLSWRWIFFVNVPIGVIALIAAWFWMSADGPRTKAKVDGVGLLLLPPGLALIVYGMSEAGSHGTLTNPNTIAGVAIGVALVGAFVVHALRMRGTALVDVRLLGNREFAAGAATTTVLAIALFGSMLLAPLYYQTVRGENALHAGLLMAPQGLGAAIAMPMAGRITDRIGAGRIVPFGILLALIGILGFTQVSASTPFVELALALFVVGLGIGASMMPAISAAYQTLRGPQVVNASPALNVMQRVGGSIGSALMAVALARFTASELPGAGGGVVGRRGQGELPPAIADKLATAFAHTYWVAFGLIAFAILPSLLLPRTAAARAPAGTLSGAEGATESAA